MSPTDTMEAAEVHFLPEAFQRTHTCGQLTLAQKGDRVVLNGWIHRVRDHGGLVFLDLRDRYGLTQAVVRAEDDATEERLVRLARSLSPEDVVAVRGQVAPRPEEMRNPDLPTGEVEVTVHDLLLLNHAATPPFVVEDPVKASEELRLRHRYLDLRRPSMQRILALRHLTAQVVRRHLDGQGFLEIETPILTKSTPEGARDFLVPSRLEHGSFYALPQSPQLYKQILMASGCDRYYQLARAMRDEDSRSDRVAEHTQIDMEMSFVTAQDVQRLVEGLMVAVFRDVLGREISTPFPRLTYDEAMARYGSDKPDLRFDLPLAEIGEWAGRSGADVLKKAAAAEGQGVFAVVVPGGGEWSRKVVGEVEDVAKALGAPGLFWAKVTAEDWQGGAARFFGPEHLSPEELQERTAEIGGREGDLILLLAGERARSLKALGAVRLEAAERLGLVGGDQYRFAWVVDFPLFEREEGGDITPCHHMFTSPREADIPRLESDPLAVRADLYDLVLNGTELGSGSIRIHRRDLQERVMALIGMDHAEANERFGHLLRAFEYGAPPHGGIALGFDRVLMHLVGTDNIRDVIAFPKTAGGVGPLEDCPSPVDEEQLTELGLRLAPRKPA